MARAVLLVAAMLLLAAPVVAAAAESEQKAAPAGQGAAKAYRHDLSLTLDAFHWGWVFGGLPNDVSDAFDAGYYFTPGAELAYLFSPDRYFFLGVAFDYLAFWERGEDDYAVNVHQFRLGPELRVALPLLEDRLRLFIGALGGLSAYTGSWEESGESGGGHAVGGFIVGLLGAEAFWGSWGLAANLRAGLTDHPHGYHMLTMLQLHVGAAYRF
jgi:hypothetical protein